MSAESAPSARAVFTLHRPDEVWPVAGLAAAPCAAGWVLQAALAELLANAIEHGNLEIGFALKAEMLRVGSFDDGIARRLATPPWGARRVRLVREFAAAAPVRLGGFRPRWLQSGHLPESPKP